MKYLQERNDLFQRKFIESSLLRDKFIEPPFSVLDTKTKSWRARKQEWLNLGIKSEVGRNATVIHFDSDKSNSKNDAQYNSVFDPVLCELLYKWFCPTNGKILDPFAGGSVRGIVANYLGYTYNGIELRKEQIESNTEQSLDILHEKNQPNYFCGDAEKELNRFQNKFDFIFTCPPYGNLEKYSDLPEDLSNMTYDDFLIKYKSIIKKSCNLLKENLFACFVVGDFRDKKGNYYGFVADTIKIFQSIGMNFYNDIVLLNMIASASMRANNSMKNKKVVKVHQNVLVFKKD